MKYVIVHNTATLRDNTSLEAIRRDHEERFGRTFYNVLITADGTVHQEHDEWNYRGVGNVSRDVGVVGDFTHEEPTNAQLDALQKVIKLWITQDDFRGIIGHKDAISEGLEASASECPGKLMEIYNGRMRKSFMNTSIGVIIDDQISEEEARSFMEPAIEYYKPLNLDIAWIRHELYPEWNRTSSGKIALDPEWVRSVVHDVNDDIFTIVTYPPKDKGRRAVAFKTPVMGMYRTEVYYHPTMTISFGEGDLNIAYHDLIHEWSHALAFLKGIEDKTHEFFDSAEGTPDYIAQFKELNKPMLTYEQVKLLYTLLGMDEDEDAFNYWAGKPLDALLKQRLEDRIKRLKGYEIPTSQ